MSLDIEDSEIGGDHPRFRKPGAFPPPDRQGGGGRLPLGGNGTGGERKKGKDRRERQKACMHRGGHGPPSSPFSGSAVQTLGRTASFTVTFAFFFNSATYASITFFPFSFRNAARIDSLTLASGTFFPSRTIVAECSA